MASSVLDKPVYILDSETYNLLCGNLTHQNAKQRDWTGIASFVGFTCMQVDHLRQHPNAGKGWLFLKTWDDTGQSSIRRLLYALLEYRMKLCIELLQNDENIRADDIQTVKREFESLKQEGQLKYLFSKIHDSKFYQVLYQPVTCRNPTSAYPMATISDDHQVERLVGHSPEITCEPKSVYVSYVSESGFSGIKTSVVKPLAEMLHKQGFKVHCKPYCEQEIKNCGGLAEWKEQCIQKCENIIVICTPAYHQEDKKWLMSCHDSQSSKPSKISVDSRLLRVLAYNPREKSRLIPLLLDSKKTRNSLECVPLWLQSAQSHSWPSGKVNLLFSLRKEQQFVLPEVKPEDIIVLKPKIISFPKRRSHNPNK